MSVVQEEPVLRGFCYSSLEGPRLLKLHRDGSRTCWAAVEGQCWACGVWAEQPSLDLLMQGRLWARNPGGSCDLEFWTGVSPRSVSVPENHWSVIKKGMWGACDRHGWFRDPRRQPISVTRSCLQCSGSTIKGEFRTVLGLSVFHLKMLMYIKLLIKKSISHHKLFLIWNI